MNLNAFSLLLEFNLFTQVFGNWSENVCFVSLPHGCWGFLFIIVDFSPSSKAKLNSLQRRTVVNNCVKFIAIGSLIGSEKDNKVC